MTIMENTSLYPKRNCSNESHLILLQKRHQFYQAIISGDIDTVTHQLSQNLTNNLMNFSKNPLENHRMIMINSLHTIALLLSMQGVSHEKVWNLLVSYLTALQSNHQIHELNKLYKNAILSFTRLSLKHQRLSQITPSVLTCIRYITNHLHEPITLNQLAEISNLSLRQLNRNFHNTFNCSPGTYIQRERLEASKTQLLTTNHSIVDIASSLSFCSESYYIKLFKNYTGMSPKQFRFLHLIQ